VADSRVRKLIRLVWEALPDRELKMDKKLLAGEIVGCVEDWNRVRDGARDAIRDGRDHPYQAFEKIETISSKVRKVLKRATDELGLLNPEGGFAEDITELRSICRDAIQRIESLAETWGSEGAKGRPETLGTIIGKWLQQLCQEKAGLSYREFGDLLAQLNQTELHDIAPLSLESLKKRKQRARKKSGTNSQK
jgi:hypothetical protein